MPERKVSVLLRRASGRCLRTCYYYGHLSPAGASGEVLLSDLRRRVFCRSTAQRLKEARSRVEEARRDVEDVIRNARSESNLYGRISSSLANGLKRKKKHSSDDKTDDGDAEISELAQLRLRVDLAAADQAHREARDIYGDLARLLEAEEDRLSLEAEILRRRGEELVESCKKSLSLSNSRRSSIPVLDEEVDEDVRGNGDDAKKGDEFGSRTTIDVLFED